MKHYLLLLIFISCGKLLSSQNLIWAQSAGGINGHGKGNSLVTDAQGNIYTTGHFGAITDFDYSTGTYTLNSKGWNDVFVSKHDSSGNLIWAKGFGGSQDDEGNSIAIDGSGNLYVTGSFYGVTDFDPDTVSSYILNGTGFNDIFILKLDNSGNFLWANRIGGFNVIAVGHTITTDNEKNVYTSGYFSTTGMDFNPGAAIDSLKCYGGSDAFLLKLDSMGNYIWAKNLGSSAGDEIGQSVVIDDSGNSLTVGYFSGSSDFNPGAGVNVLYCSGYTDTFILKLDKNGNYIWAKKTGGPGMEQGHDLLTTTDKNIYITGFFEGSSDFNPSLFATYTLTAVSGGLNTYIVKLDSSGNFKWAKNLGGNQSNNISKSITKDASDNIYITGCYSGSTDFDPGIDSIYVIASINSSNAGYVLQLNSQGNFIKVIPFGKFCYGTFGEAITLDKTNNIFVTGYFSGNADFDPDENNTYYLTDDGYEDMFLVKFGGTTVGLNELSIVESELSVFPNPCNGILNIRSKEKMKISISNELGQTIDCISLGHENNFQVRVPHLSSGIYFIYGQSDKGSIHQKIIVTQ